MEESKLAVPEYLDNAFFQEVLRNYLKRPDGNIDRIELSMGCGSGENFCSVIYRVRVQFSYDKSKCESATWIVKSMPYVGEYEVFEDMQLFKKESETYFKILPELDKFAQTNFGPSCYYVTSTPIDTIVFEDLKLRRLRQIDRFNAIDESHCAIVFSKLAKFHAASMHLAEKNPNIFDNFQIGMYSERNFQAEQNREFFLKKFQMAIKITERTPGYESIAKKMKVLEPTYIQRAWENFDSKKGLLKVLNHGDLWRNNLFFKYESDESNIPTECFFIDYQGCIYSGPGIDINYFLNTSVQIDILKGKRDYLLKECYYQTLRKTLEELSYKKVPTYSDVEADILNYEFFGLFSAIGSSINQLIHELSYAKFLEGLNDEKRFETCINLAPRADKFRAKLEYVLRRADSMGLLDQ